MIKASYFEIDPNSHLFSYTKTQDFTTRVSKQNNRQESQKTDLEIYFMDSEINFLWKWRPLPLRENFQKINKVYAGKYIRRN